MMYYLKNCVDYLCRWLRARKGAVFDIDVDTSIDASLSADRVLAALPSDVDKVQRVSDARQQSQTFRRNGYLFSNTSTASPLSNDDDEDATGGCARCVPVSSRFRRRRLVRVPASRGRLARCGAVPEGLADLEQPVLAASMVHSAIHPVLSSMKGLYRFFSLSK